MRSAHSIVGHGTELMPYDRLPDDKLTDLIRQRDRAAWSVLYDRYARQAHAVALLVTCEPATAAAVIEELFWEVWRCGMSWQPGASVRNSLMLGARRIAERIPARQA